MKHLVCVFIFALTVTFAGTVGAQPDVITSNTGDIDKYGTVGGVTGYALASTSCNIGNQVADWFASSNNHPLIAQDIYRIDGEGLITHIGMSWLKHSFCAVNEYSCGSCQETPCSTLGINCADTYGTFLNADQPNLGPRYDVNATTGNYSYPFPTQGQGGNSIYKRLQVANSDLNPNQNPDAEYFGVVQYLTTDEPAFGTQFNNASYRKINVGSQSGGGWNLSYTGSTQQQKDPINCWKANDGASSGDPDDVTRHIIDTMENGGNVGRMVVGTRVIDLGGGMYRYLYAVYNMNSHRSARAFAIPIPNGIPLSNVRFNAVQRHSGSPYSNDDWDLDTSGNSIEWSCEPANQNQDANALRWSTTFSFAFEAPAPPVDTDGTLTYYRGGGGGPGFELFPTKGPSGDFTAPVTDLNCFYSAGAAQLMWLNGEPYDSVEITRDGDPLAVLPGDAESFSDPDAEEGLHTYGVTGVIPAGASGAVSCEVDVPPPPPLGFGFVALSQDVGYDMSSGTGSFVEPFAISEDPTNPDFPHAITGFSMSVTHDSDMLDVTAVDPGSDLAAVNGGDGPAFFAETLLSDGFTVGVIFDFNLDTTMTATTELEMVLASYDTVAGNLAGNAAGASTALEWQDLGDPIVYNSLVVETLGEQNPIFTVGIITLDPIVGVQFTRGDVNGDGELTIADPIMDLDYQFQGGPSICLQAHDFDDSGVIGLEDSLANLAYQFQSGPPAAPPFPGCGLDQTPDALDCAGPVTCP